jgi:hypothetical protein
MFCAVMECRFAVMKVELKKMRERERKKKKNYIERRPRMKAKREVDRERGR